MYCRRAGAGTGVLIQTSTESSEASYYGEQGLHYVDVHGQSCMVPRGMDQHRPSTFFFFLALMYA